MAAAGVASAQGGIAGSSTPPAGRLSLWYQRPAKRWVEALPVGNGRLGAMVFGGVPEERLQLNEDTVWAKYPLERDRDGAHHTTDAWYFTSPIRRAQYGM